jgi:hypothetical protein
MNSAGHLAWHVHLEQGTETATSNRPQLLGACPSLSCFGAAGTRARLVEGDVCHLADGGGAP